LLKRSFSVDQPNKPWDTDITYLRTWQGWLYLTVVIDLHSRKVVGWFMKTTLAKELVLDGLMNSVWRRKPKQSVVHSDQGFQYGSDDWQRFCKHHNLPPSMARRGNCWGHAVAESFFGSLKSE
jgi:putative transposase